MTKLDRLFGFERWVCLGLLSAGLCYGLYSAYLVTEDFSHILPKPDYKEDGWFFGMKVDRTKEWVFCLSLIKLSFLWWCIHLVGAEMCRKHSKESLADWCVQIGVFYTTYTFGIATTVSFTCCIATTFLVLFCRSRLLLWAYSLAYMVWWRPHMDQFWYSLFGGPLDEQRSYHADMTHKWIMLRCLSYSLDHVQADKEPSLKHLYDLMVYNFYLPVMNSGPIISYKEFDDGMSKPYQPWTAQRLACFCLNILRYLAWAVFTDVMMHYVHFNSLLRHPQALYEFSSWALFGLSYVIMSSFTLTYVVQYGLPSVFVRNEQIHVTAHPSCIAAVELGSKVWQQFDRGLYNFVVKYIYEPCSSFSKSFIVKMFASTLSFGFVYIFYKTRNNILIWTVLSFIVLTVEYLLKSVESTKKFQIWKISWLSPSNACRASYVLYAPLFLMSHLTNMYFFGQSAEVANAFAARLFTIGWREWLLLGVLSYCVGHAADFLNKYYSPKISEFSQNNFHLIQQQVEKKEETKDDSLNPTLF